MGTKLLLKEKSLQMQWKKKPRKISLNSRGLKCLRNSKIHKILEKLFQHLSIEKYKVSFENNSHEMEKSRIWSSLELEPSGSTQKPCCHCKTPLKQNLSWTPHVLQRQVGGFSSWVSKRRMQGWSCLARSLPSICPVFLQSINPQAALRETLSAAPCSEFTPSHCQPHQTALMWGFLVGAVKYSIDFLLQPFPKPSYKSITGISISKEENNPGYIYFIDSSLCLRKEVSLLLLAILC